MRRLVLLAAAALLLVPLAAAQTPQTVLFPGTTGGPLLDSLDRAFSPTRTLGYGPARDLLYGEIDLQPGDSLEGVYTGHTVRLDFGAQPDPSQAAFAEGINTEHTWPRSLGADGGPAESDMHHLFPTRVEVNSERANNPFADIPDAETTWWWIGDRRQAAVPQTDIDAYSESTSARFEPREAFKGDVARAMFYFRTVYPERADGAFFREQRETLRRWHEQVDPVSTAEYARSEAIADRQGTANPFVLDSTLVRRAFFEADGVGTAAEAVPAPTHLALSSPAPHPFRHRTAVRLIAPPAQTVRVELFDALGRRVRVLFEGTPPAAGLVLHVDGAALAPGLYLLRAATDRTAATRRLVRR